jgi:hypothetical protein
VLIDLGVDLTGSPGKADVGAALDVVRRGRVRVRDFFFVTSTRLRTLLVGGTRAG